MTKNIYHIALCDDSFSFTQQLEAEIQSHYSHLNIHINVHTFTDGIVLLDAISQHAFDIVFLDIDMPTINGFDLAKELSTHSPSPLIIFCTMHHDLVYDSFAYQPFWFLCKHNYHQHLSPVLQKAYEKRPQATPTYTFKCGGDLHTVQVDTIQYIDVHNHKLNLYIDQETTLQTRETLSNIELSFTSYGFFRINHGCMVNLRSIKHIISSDVILKDGTTLPISRSKLVPLKKSYLQWLR